MEIHIILFPSLKGCIKYINCVYCLQVKELTNNKSTMTTTKIYEDIQVLAMENMTEDGIHHDDYPDHEGEYIEEILKELTKINA